MTRRLLEYWADPQRDNKILFCQREAVETAIFLAEAATKWGGGWALNSLDEQNAEHNGGLPRVALKMATGTGKTVVMAMLIAWQTINKVNEPYKRLFAKRFLVVAPGLTIRDRLRVLLPEDPENYYRQRDLVPAEFLPDLGQAKIVITNFHAFQQRETREGRGLSSNTKAFLAPDRPNPFRETPGQMVSRVLRSLGGSSEIVVLNDEAHHCYRGRIGQPEAEADTVETLKGDDRKTAQQREEDARIWFAGLEAIRAKIGIKRIYDLSATPFFLSGSGYREGTLFPWVVSDFSLIDAIESGIVKIPRVPVDDNRVSRNVTYLNLWENIRDHLPKSGRRTGVEFTADDLPPTLDGRPPQPLRLVREVLPGLAGVGRRSERSIATGVHRGVQQHDRLEGDPRLGQRLRPGDTRGQHPGAGPVGALLQRRSWAVAAAAAVDPGGRRRVRGGQALRRVPARRAARDRGVQTGVRAAFPGPLDG